MNELRINSIESFSTKDGDGIRSVVFLQGCHLRCAYCHNPETWNMKGGEKITATELAERLMRFKDYWGRNGGVTISGGEPLLQAKELLEFLTLLKQQKINIALETSGTIMNKYVSKVINACDLIIFDLKDKDNLHFLDEAEAAGKRIWVRIVIVPEINDTKEHIQEYAKIFKNRKIEKVELIPFHTLGFQKYEELGIENTLANTKPCSVTKIRELQSCFDSISK